MFGWVFVMGCLVVLLRMLKGMFFVVWVCLKGCLVVLLSMLKEMFGYITEYA